MEDDRIAVIEAQLAQAKQIADEADRKYEEVKKAGINFEESPQIPRKGTRRARTQTHTLFS